ncbi:MAG: hypothetical protein WC391_09560, partial [Methanoregula sp.]
MNNRWGEPLRFNELLPTPGHGSAIPDSLSAATGILSPAPAPVFVPQRKPAVRAAVKKVPGMTKDTMFVVRRGSTFHVISEDYSYKTEPYYTILQHEVDGKIVSPTSRQVLDAFVVPICLERLKSAGIPVCEWGISQAYVPFPSILYGLNYFATSSDYFVV